MNKEKNLKKTKSCNINGDMNHIDKKKTKTNVKRKDIRIELLIQVSEHLTND